MNKKESSFRTLKMAAWLSWQIESNWTDPFLFAVYSIIKPISAAFMIVIMYSIITQGDFNSPTFAFLFLGNALYQYVPALLSRYRRKVTVLLLSADAALSSLPG